MLKRIKFIWKLGVAFLAVSLAVFLAMSYINGLVEEGYAVSTARDISSSYFKAIHNGLTSLMETHDIGDIRKLIRTLAESNPTSCDIRLISHGEGGIVASYMDIDNDTLVNQNSHSCRACHDLDNVKERLAVVRHAEIVELSSGEKIISVTMPIFNEEGCRKADCHAHADATPVLGLMEADFSLVKADFMAAQRNLWSIPAIIIVILLSSGFSWFLLKFIVKRRVRRLLDGVSKPADWDFDSRLVQNEKDEFDWLAESFNDMVSMLSYSLRELKKSRDYLESVLESSADIIITVGVSGNIRTFNAGAEKALGYARFEVIGKPIEMLFADPQERKIAIDKLQYTDNVLNYETRFKTKAGKIRNVLLTLSRFRNPDGEVIGTMGISKDITREKRLQEQLIQSQRYAAIGQVFTGIQHSMKNMLNACMGGAYMVKTGLAMDNRKMLEEGWQIVQDGISSMTDMSVHMLKYVKDWKPNFKRADLTQMLSEIYRVFKQTGKDKGVEFRLDIPPRLPGVLCDSGMIHSAVMDIVSNAMDACLSKEYTGTEIPEVVIAAHSADNNQIAVIEIKDNGCGMTEEVKSNIFTPFFSTKDRAGTGLGLSTTLRMINIHGGRIDAESEPNKGSLFRISLPIEGIIKNKEILDA